MKAELTPAHVKALATLLLTIRPDWSNPYVHDAIAKMRDKDTDLERIVRVAVRGALSPNIRKPDVLPMNGEHWKAQADEPTAGAPPNPRYHDRCGEFHAPGASCEPPDDHRPSAPVPTGTRKAAYQKVARPSKVRDNVASRARQHAETVETTEERL